jgi:membrane-associated protease RseP (regulator of RpoE activity)
MSRWIGSVMGVASLAATGLAISPNVKGAGADEDRGRRVQVMRIGGGAYLGVRLDDVDKDDVARLKLPEERGAIVKGVEKDTPAEKAGLKEGDVIVRYQGETVWSAAQLARLVRETPPGRTVTIEVSRGGATQKLSARLEEGRRRFHLEGDFEVPVPPEPPLPPETFRFEDLGERLKDLGKGRRLLWRDGWILRAPRKLGIQYQEIEGQLAGYFRLTEDEGVLVTSVDEGSPAARAGVKAGDVILKLAGKAVRDGRDLRRALGEADPGEEITLTVQRDGKPLDLTVRLEGEKPRQGSSTTT